MTPESEIPAIERLSRNDREILSQPEVRAAIAGTKPAAFEDWHGSIQDLQGVRDYLSSVGVDALVTPRIILNRAATLRRIAEEPRLAALAGWKEGMGPDDLATAFESMSTAHENDVLRGFLVGFPASAILGFRRKEELRLQGVPTVLGTFFDAASKSVRSVVTNADGIATLDRMAAEYAGLPKHHWDAGPDRPSPEDERALLDRFRPELSALYQRYWNLSEQDADSLAWQKSVEIRDRAGQTVCTFGTFGKDGDKAPDVQKLQEKALALAK